MLVIINIGTDSQRGLTWEEAVEEFNLSRTAMYGRKTTLSCGTTLTFVRETIKIANNLNMQNASSYMAMHLTSRQSKLLLWSILELFR